MHGGFKERISSVMTQSGCSSPSLDSPSFFACFYKCRRLNLIITYISGPLWFTSHILLCESNVMGSSALVETGLFVPKEESAMSFLFFLTVESYWTNVSHYSSQNRFRLCEDMTLIRWYQVRFKDKDTVVIFSTLNKMPKIPVCPVKS